MRKIVLKSAIAMLVVSVLPIPGFISNAAARLFEIGLSPPAGGALNLGSTTYTRDHATFWTAANESSQPASPATGNEIGPGIT